MKGVFGWSLLIFKLQFAEMSSKKIIRLKTPSRGKDLLNSHQEYYQQSCNLDEETVMKGALQQSVNNGYGVLIEELNKSYKQIQNLKDLLEESQQIRQALLDENELLKGRLDMLERECLLEKEKYHLERENHERLRGFYETREKEWMGILTEQRRLLEYYDIKNDRPEETKTQKNKAQTTARTKNNEESQKFPFYSSRDGFQKRLSSKGLRSLKKSYSASKNRLSQGHNFFHRFFEEAETKWQVPQSERRSPEKSSLKEIQESEQPKMSYHKQQSDELFQKIVRQTFYRMRDEGKQLASVFESQDMVKLKKAKTSTRERLEKTLKKLRFDIENQKEMRIFIDHIEKEIVEKHQEFRGDFVACFLIQKLKECESLALGSNSEINRFCSQAQSLVSMTIHEKQKEEKEDKVELVKSAKSGTLIDQLKSSNFELLLTSNVKVGEKQKKVVSVMKEAEMSDVLRHSGESSLMTLSDLINASRDYLQEMTRG